MRRLVRKVWARYVVSFLAMATAVLVAAPVVAWAEGSGELPASLEEQVTPPAAPTAAPSPKFGGCLRGNRTCFAPTVSVNVLAISLKDGTVTTEFNPGLGYGVTFATDRWYRSGLAAQFALRQVSGVERPQVALLGSFAEYLRLGVATPLWAGSFKDHAQLLLSFGSDFGGAVR